MPVLRQTAAPGPGKPKAQPGMFCRRIAASCSSATPVAAGHRWPLAAMAQGCGCTIVGLAALRQTMRVVRHLLPQGAFGEQALTKEPTMPDVPVLDSFLSVLTQGLCQH